MRRFRKKYKPHTKEENQAFGLLIVVGALLVILGSLWTSIFQISKVNGILVIISAILILLVVLGFIIWAQKFIRRKIVLNTTLSKIDSMSGIEFEQFVAKLLQEDGYLTQTTATTGDFGVDLIAKKDNAKIAIQIKRYNSAVGVEAVYQAVAGKKYYQCNRCMVITSSTFTKAAYEMARVHYCTLVDRVELANWMERVVKKQN